MQSILFSETDLDFLMENASINFSAEEIGLINIKYFRYNISLDKAKQHAKFLADRSGIVPMIHRYNDDIYELVGYIPYKPKLDGSKIDV